MAEKSKKKSTKGETRETQVQPSRKAEGRVEGFRGLAERIAAGEQVVLPALLSGQWRREHVRSTLREDHATRIEQRSHGAKAKFDELADDFSPEGKRPAQTPEDANAAFQAAVDTARGADMVIMVLGENANMAGEAASRGSLDLPGRQEELLETIVALGKPVVLVLLNGRPLSINWAAENVSAILEAWEPGTEGGHAVADILFGDANPGGKLPVTFPRSGSHAPLYYARTLTHAPEGSPMYRSRYWDSLTTPLFPFGFGLSYTTFSITNLAVSASKVKVGEHADRDR